MPHLTFASLERTLNRMVENGELHRPGEGEFSVAPRPPPPPHPLEAALGKMVISVATERPCGCTDISQSDTRGCRPCQHKQCQIHDFLKNSQVDPPVNFFNNRAINITKPLDCCTPMVYMVYMLQCTRHMKVYVGSTRNVKARFSAHRSDMINGRGIDCGFCNHWATEHKPGDDLTGHKLVCGNSRTNLSGQSQKIK